MASWQKRARLVIAALGIAVVVLVAFTLRQRHAPPATRGVKRMDPTAVSESSGVRATQSTGLKVPGVVDAERTLAYADGTSKLINPKITTDRSGLQYVITSKEARVGADQSNVAMNGDVRLVSSDGLDATTTQASYSRGEGVVRAPGRVNFAKGTLSGTAIGMTYDQGRDVLWLLDQAVVKVAPGEKTGAGADITAGTAGYARRDNYMRFERGVKLVREGRIVEADAATAFLGPDGGRLQNMELRGNSRIVSRGAAPGGLQAMRSTDMNLTYGPDGETLERAVLAGNAAIQLTGESGKAGRRIAGEYVDVAFGAGGDITQLTARDRVELLIPADKDAPERVIRSTAMEGTGKGGQGLTSARFIDGVEFREARGPGQLRIARARTLDVVMQPGSGAIDEANFSGSTRFEDGALRASAADGRYQIAKGVLHLSGSEGPNDPRVQDERVTVDAKKIDLTFEGTRLVAIDNVRSVLKPAPKATDPKAKTAQKVPGLLKADRPVNVTGATLNYDGGNSLATYNGAARLWQDETTIQGDTIVLDEKTGDLKANSKDLVRSAFTLEQMDQKTGEKKAFPSLATGKDLHYEDALRRATYTTEAHVNGPQGDCHAVKIELYFVEAGGSLERAEAYEQVKLIADGRTATGARMTYFAADERYLMTGAPVTIIEECRETTGKTLTFWRSTDRILVDGNEEIRTKTRNGGTCTEQHFE